MKNNGDGFGKEVRQLFKEKQEVLQTRESLTSSGVEGLLLLAEAAQSNVEFNVPSFTGIFPRPSSQF